MTEIARCTNCGAPMAAQAIDGRIRECSHCGARIQDSIDGAQIAAGMALDLADTDAFLRQLSTALRHGFAERARVTHEGVRVILIELDLGKDMFVAKRDAERVIGQHKKMVRGVALKTTIHPLDIWVGLLAKAIAAHVNDNARVAQVLSQLRVD